MSNRPRKTAATRTKTPEQDPAMPEQGEGQRPMKASEGGVNLDRIIARYEATIGKLTSSNIMLEEQLEGTKVELGEVKAALDELIARLPKSESTDAPSNGKARAKKTAASKPAPEIAKA